MEWKLSTCHVRSWKAADMHSLVRHANNHRVSRQLRDRFPHPYTAKHARAFLSIVLRQQPETLFAIAVDGEAVGGIGFHLQTDVERVSAEIGYWLGESVWGRGIATEALSAVTQHAVATHGLTRVFAVPFAENTASCRVLEQ